MSRRIVVIAWLFWIQGLDSVGLAQATDLERLFIERVNVIRAEVGHLPLTLIEEHRQASANHVDYILSSGQVCHDQVGTNFPNGSDRVEYFS